MPRGLPDSFAMTAALRAGRRISRGTGRGRSGAGYKFFQIDFKKVVLYKPIVNYELNAKTGMVGRHLSVLGTKIVAGAKRQVGVKTGKLMASIHMAHYATGRKQYIRVGSAVKYALMHHEGTLPHVITPHPPKTHLRFTICMLILLLVLLLKSILVAWPVMVVICKQWVLGLLMLAKV
jgi:hypothetical protein